MVARISCRRRPKRRRSAALLGFAGLSLLAANAWSADAGPGPGSGGGKPYRVETYRLDGPGTLLVRTSGGHIFVDGSDRDDVQVEMYVRRHGRNLAPEDMDLDDFDIDIHQADNGITATAAHKHSWRPRWSDVSISFVVHTPRAMAAELKTSGGSIELTGVQGDQTVSTSGGHLKLVRLSGKVDAHTSGGSIEIAEFKGQMDATTSGGPIDVDDADGKLTLRTSGGHIRLNRLRGSVEAHTSGGDIEADLVRVDDDVRLETSGGSIHISVPDDMALTVDLRGSHVSSHLVNFSGEIDRNEVHGRINGGGHHLDARTSGGGVSVAFASSTQKH